MENIEADYVIVGAGAVGLSFADVILSESDFTVAIVDKQARPGGHWNHAYPFVRLHQPSSFYGVPSRQLGHDQIEADGLNAGFYELATSAEILAYYEELLRETFLPSGRVTYLSMHEYLGEGQARSLLTGEMVSLTARRKVVDARYLGSVVPSMREHIVSFKVADSVDLATPNDLAFLESSHGHYVIVGAGKTSADSCIFLLEQGVAPEAITWVRPRDGWFLNRAIVQPGARFADSMLGGYTAMLEAAAAATSVDDLTLRYEEAGAILRIDPTYPPTFYRGATMSQSEISLLGNIEHVVRLGYVNRVDDGLIELSEGQCLVPRDSLFVDCTAEGLRQRPATQIFHEGVITLQYVVNGGQTTYSAALTAMVELCLDADEQRNEHLSPAPISSHLSDLASNFLVELKNQAKWAQLPRLSSWIDHTRLNPAMEARASLDLTDPRMLSIVNRMLSAIEPATENLELLTRR